MLEVCGRIFDHSPKSSTHEKPACFGRLVLGVGLDQSYLESLYARTIVDEHSIDTLIRRFNCSHVYFDMGANIGVQVRKLYEGALYKNARVLPLFHATFGPQPHCDVCSIAIEPNPVHSQRLKQLQSLYQRAGAGVLVLMAAVSDSDGVTVLTGFNRSDGWIRRHGGASLQIAASIERTAALSSAGLEDATKAVLVRTVDLARLVRTVDQVLVNVHGPRSWAGTKIAMKMDIEGSEHQVLPHMLHTKAMCLVNRVYMECVARHDHEAVVSV